MTKIDGISKWPKSLKYSVRPCLTSLTSVCRAFNLTSFLVSTSEPFDVVINCDNYDKTVSISNVTYIRIPIECSVTGPSLKIPTLHTMFSSGVSHQTFQIPFQIKDLELTFNTSGLDGSLRRQLSLKGVRDLIKTRIPRATPVDTDYQVQMHKSISIGALSLSSTGILIIIATVILLYIFRAKVAACFQ